MLSRAATRGFRVLPKVSYISKPAQLVSVHGRSFQFTPLNSIGSIFDRIKLPFDDSNRAANPPTAATPSMKPEGLSSSSASSSTTISSTASTTSSTSSATAPASTSSTFEKFSASQEILDKIANSNKDGSEESAFAMIPEEIVSELDKYIIGQTDAKKAVAIAMRSRWRRQQLHGEMQTEVHPVNILLMGPTGSGKTEIARRVAKLSGAPFVKVEATRYTEVGVVGTNTDQMIKDLADVAYKTALEKQYARHRLTALSHAEDIIIGILKITRLDFSSIASQKGLPATTIPEHEQMREWLREGVFDDDIIDIELPSNNSSPEFPQFLPMSVNGIEQADYEIFEMPRFEGGRRKGRKRTKKVKVSEAIHVLVEAEAAKLADKEAAKAAAVQAVEETGIVFVDEIDKLSRLSEEGGGGRISTSASKGEGVQKELLSLIEGTVVHTKLGSIRTNHILFVGSGAFYHSKPTDLLPELQGRMPIRVPLKPLSEEEFRRVLVEPKCSLIQQQIALLRTEHVDLKITDDAIEEIAKVSAQLNNHVENIGARRLQSVLAAIMSDISFAAAGKYKQAVAEAKAAGKDTASVTLEEKIDAEYVRSKVAPLMEKTDLSKYVL